LRRAPPQRPDRRLRIRESFESDDLSLDHAADGTGVRAHNIRPFRGTAAGGQGNSANGERDNSDGNRQKQREPRWRHRHPQQQQLSETEDVSVRHAITDVS